MLDDLKRDFDKRIASLEIKRAVTMTLLISLLVAVFGLTGSIVASRMGKCRDQVEKSE
jgi:hypothetical protein